ncbi:MAG: hypothetical protein PVG78_12830 [Desulfobacterales bacterium]|jgi:hypothetical protein
MTDFIDPIHFRDLSAEDPGDVCKRALCRYDPDPVSIGCGSKKREEKDEQL